MAYWAESQICLCPRQESSGWLIFHYPAEEKIAELPRRAFENQRVECFSLCFIGRNLHSPLA